MASGRRAAPRQEHDPDRRRDRAPTTAWRRPSSRAGSACGRCSSWHRSRRPITSARSSRGCAPQARRSTSRRAFYASFLLAAWLTVAKAGPGLRTPYFVPPGGSTPLGCVGYVQRGPGAPRPGHRRASCRSRRTSSWPWAVAAPPRASSRASASAGLRSRLLCVVVSDADPARGPQRRAPGPTDAPPPRRARRRRARGPGSRRRSGSSGAGSAQATAVRRPRVGAGDGARRARASDARARSTRRRRSRRSWG